LIKYFYTGNCQQYLLIDRSVNLYGGLLSGVSIYLHSLKTWDYRGIPPEINRIFHITKRCGSK